MSELLDEVITLMQENLRLKDEIAASEAKAKELQSTIDKVFDIIWKQDFPQVDDVLSLLAQEGKENES